MSMFFFY